MKDSYNGNNQIVISTIDDMETHLQNLQQNVSTSVSHALKAQLETLKYVSSPDLIDSSLDLLLKNMKQAIKFSLDEREKQIIREKNHLLIHNYIFFLNAKLEYVIQSNRNEGEALLKQACNQIVNSTMDIILLAGGPTKIAPKLLVDQLTSNILKKTKESNSGFFNRVINYFFNTRERRENNNFLRTLELLFEKLERHKNLIGESDLIEGLINRHAEKVAEFKNRSYYNNIGRKPEFERKTDNDDIINVVSIIFFIALGLLVVTSIITMIIDLIPSFDSPFKDGAITHAIWSRIGIISLCVLGIELIYLSIISIIELINFRGYKKELNFYNEKVNLYNKKVETDLNNYKNLANSFAEL